MIVKQVAKKKNEKELALEDPFNKNDSQVESSVDIPGLNKLKKDTEYSKNKESKLSDKDQK
jgi:hypothetical protein